MTYLQKIYRHSKLGFSFLILFLIIQLLAGYRQQENFPCLNYAMYSGKVKSYAQYSSLVLYINNEKMVLQQPYFLKEAFVYYTLSYYTELQKNNYIDEQEAKYQAFFSRFLDISTAQQGAKNLTNSGITAAIFATWLRQYLQAYCTQKINNIRLTEQFVQYTYYTIKPLEEQLVFDISF